MLMARVQGTTTRTFQIYDAFPTDRIFKFFTASSSSINNLSTKTIIPGE
jgi:hypothetical protein